MERRVNVDRIYMCVYLTLGHEESLLWFAFRGAMEAHSRNHQKLGNRHNWGYAGLARLAGGRAWGPGLVSGSSLAGSHDRTGREEARVDGD